MRLYHVLDDLPCLNTFDTFVVSQAVHYYRRAAVAGHHQAQYRCAKLLLSSRGQQSSETDAAAALNFLYAAADAGLTEVQLIFTLLNVPGFIYIITYMLRPVLDPEFHCSRSF